MRYKAARFYRADGRLVGDMRDLPLRTSQLDRVYRFRPTKGRAWPHDIALAGGTRPVVAYTAREGGPEGSTPSTTPAGTARAGARIRSSAPDAAR